MTTLLVIASEAVRVQYWKAACRGRTAGLVCCADLTFAAMSGIDVGRWQNVAGWAARVRALPRFKAPFDPAVDGGFRTVLD